MNQEERNQIEGIIIIKLTHHALLTHISICDLCRLLEVRNW